MNIALFGESASTYSFAQELLNLNNVSSVFHYGANHKVYSSSRYHPLFTLDKDLKNFILNLPKQYQFDLIFPTTLNFQIWKDFKTVMEKTGIPLILPDHEITELEWSKVKGKQFLLEADIPTTDFSLYNKSELIENFFAIPRPYVLKYDRDWRAGGQTVIITDDNVEDEFVKIKESSRYFMSEEEVSPQNFLIEKFIKIKKEFSYHMLCNNKGWRYIGSSRDYKKRYDGDLGFNTAGMGAYSPVEHFDTRAHIFADKIFNLLKNKKFDTRLVLYLGMAVDINDNLLVLEINTRPGDPEFQTIYPLIENNLADLFYKAGADEELPCINFKNKSTVALRVVHRDYDLLKQDVKEFPQLWPVTGKVQVSPVKVQVLLHSVITSVDDNLELARDNIYNFLKNKPMGEFTFRTDIGYVK